MGADDFVIDSYRIREGKLAILEMEGKCIGIPSQELLEESPDRIGEGDLLNISLHHPLRADIAQAVASVNANFGFRIHNGQIKLPDIPSFPVEGLTLQEAKERIEDEYRLQNQDVEVFVSYKDRPEKKVDLLGLVQQSSVPLKAGMHLFEVLSQAKIAPQANLFKSYVVRGDQLLPVDLTRLVREGDMSQNIAMRGGDKVYIAESSSASLMVLGEVGKERVIDLPSGTMTLRQAIAEAGGIPYSGDKRYIQVIRGNLVCPKIYTLHWEHIVRLPSDSLLLMPGDIVYVAAKPIAEWNRFVNQILPTIIGADILLRGAKNVGFNLP